MSIIARRQVARLREARSWHWRCQGLSQREIVGKLEAEGLGRVSRVAVTKMLARSLRRLAEITAAEVAEFRAIQIALLTRSVNELWDEWENSKEAACKLRRREIRPGAGESGPALVEETTVIEGRLGNVQYLAELRATLAEIRKLVPGIEPSARPGPPTVGRPHEPVRLSFDGLSDEEMDTYLALAAKLERAGTARRTATVAGTAATGGMRPSHRT